ncbi:MAG: hypothetical protein ACT4OZ_04550 [Gemmatimonadota bacterium]
MRLAPFLVVTVASILAARSLDAQRPREPGLGPQRAQLEQRFRNRLRDVMQRRLELTDGQLDRLGGVNQRFEARRRELIAEERQVRLVMRRQLAPGTTADQDEIARLLERALRVQRERIDLIEAEQRELATFLTPLQRARYFGLQEQLRRQIDELSERPPATRRPGRPVPPRF